MSEQNIYLGIVEGAPGKLHFIKLSNRVVWEGTGECIPEIFPEVLLL